MVMRTDGRDEERVIERLTVGEGCGGGGESLKKPQLDVAKENFSP
jgi:hypothetical protein